MDIPLSKLSPNRRMGPSRRIINIVGGMFFGLLILGFVAVRGCGCGPFMGPSDVEALKREAASIIATVDRYVGTHGHPPKNFAETGERLPMTSFGPWIYETYDDGFGLIVGDYFKNLGVLRWYSVSRQWHEDR